MKTLIALGAVFAGAAVAAGGVAYFLSSAPARTSTSETLAAAPGASAVSAGEIADLRDEVRSLTDSVRKLQMDLAGLRSQASREPLAAEPRVDESSAPLATAAVSPVQIDQRVREVLAAERQREEEQAEQERVEREREAAVRQAERIAERLSLAPADQQRLAGHLVNAQDKRRSVMEGMRDAGFDRDAMRTTFEELRDWNNTELNRLFGPDVGGQIAEQTNNMGRGGFGGAPGGGGRGGGGRGGG